MIDTALVGDGVHKHKQDPVAETGVVGSVSPKPVHTCGNSEASNGPQTKGEYKGLPFGFEEAQQASDSGKVSKSQIDDHRPVDVTLLVMEGDRVDDVENHPSSEALEDL